MRARKLSSWLRCRKQSDPKDALISLKIAVGSEDLPVTPMRNRTNEKIDSRSGNAATATGIVHPRCLFVVYRFWNRVLEGSQGLADLAATFLLADSREHFLPYYAQCFDTAFANEFSECLGQRLLVNAKISGFAPQSQRPHRGVNQDVHEYRLCRSTL